MPKLYSVAWLAIVLYATWVHLWYGHNDVILALSGFSALDFTNWTLYPENFVRDYPGGSWSSGNSLLTHIYPVGQSLLGLPAESMLTVMIGLEISCLSLAAAFLLRKIFPDAPRVTSVFIAALFALSWVRAGNLSNFGNPFFHGQFYGFADGIAMIAVGLFLGKRYLLSAIVFAVGFTIHPTKVLFALAFVGGVHLWQWRHFFHYRVVLPYIALGCFAVFWLVFWLNINSSAAGLSAEEFFKYSGLLNYHWYPSSLGIFTFLSSRFIIPCISAVVLLFAILLRSDMGSVLKGQMALGILALVLLCAFGLYVAGHDLSQSIVKASFQRASELILSIAVIVTVAQTARDLKYAKWWFAALGLCILSAGFFDIYNTWPVLLSLVYAILAIEEYGRQPRASYKAAYALTALVVLVFLAVFTIDRAGYLSSSITVSWLYWLLLAFAVAVLLKVLHQVSYKRVVLNNAFPLLLLVVVAGLGHYWGQHNYVLSESKIEKGRAAKALQLWVNKNTQPDALFVLDPCDAYGWRDYSARSSWGTLEEWLKSGWLYSGDRKALREGLKRAGMLGVQIPDGYGRDEQGNRSQASHISAELCEIARSHFYDPDAESLLRIAREYDIQYIVMNKPEATKYGTIPSWDTIYENMFYTILIPPVESKNSGSS